MGYSGTKDFWSAYFIKTLAKSYKVITFDNRGMGLTTSGVKEFTIPQFADDTAGFMDAMGIQKAHVFSWSMGTNIALSLVTRYPQKVNKLILFAGDCGGPQAIQPTPENNAKLTDTSGTEAERFQRFLELLFPPDWLKKNPDSKKYLPTVTEKASTESINKQTIALDKWFKTGVYSSLPGITQKV